MYVISGELHVRQRPEDFLGQYGLSFVHSPENPEESGGIFELETYVVDDSRKVVTSVLTSLQNNDLASPEAEVEHITTLEQATRYVREKKISFEHDYKVLPNVISELAELTDSTAKHVDVLDGVADIWDERRFPSNRLYFRAAGILLNRLEYAPEHGWKSAGEVTQGERNVTGLVTPWSRNTQKQQMVQIIKNPS